MTPAIAELLTRAPRCVLAIDDDPPRLAPMAFWSDGDHLWMTTAASSAKVRRLRDDPECRVYVPPGADALRGVVIDGRARVFSINDPIGLAVHGPMVAGAMGALIAKEASAIVGYVQDGPKIPTDWRPHNRVVLRIRVDRAQSLLPPDIGLGIAPALPTVVPADVRRALAGARRVTLAHQTDNGVAIVPCVWGAGFALTTPDGHALPHGVAAVVTVDMDPQGRPSEVVGLALRGQLGADAKLAVDHARWWKGFVSESAPVLAQSGIQLPD